MGDLTMSNFSTQTVNFKKGNEAREQLSLPPLYFVAMDQWIEVLGEKALFSWLKMYTWCDRDLSKNDKPNDVNLFEESKIPTSMNKIIKRLQVGRGTFYNKIIKPLWNAGLIDIEIYEDSTSDGTKPLNIIVYKYPQNNKALSFVPLVFVRDYDKDYSSRSKTFAKMGGRRKKEDASPEIDVNGALGNLKSKDSSNLTQEGVLSENGGGFCQRTEGGSVSEHNNKFNMCDNSFNNVNNNFNNKNQTKPNPYSELNELDIPIIVGRKIKENMVRIGQDSIKLSDIEIHFNTCQKLSDSNSEHTINQYEYADILDNLLQKASSPIRSIKALMNSWIDTYIGFKQTDKLDQFYNWLDGEEEPQQVEFQPINFKHTVTDIELPY